MVERVDIGRLTGARSVVATIPTHAHTLRRYIPGKNVTAARPSKHSAYYRRFRYLATLNGLINVPRIGEVLTTELDIYNTGTSHYAHGSFHVCFKLRMAQEIEININAKTKYANDREFFTARDTQISYTWNSRKRSFNACLVFAFQSSAAMSLPFSF